MMATNRDGLKEDWINSWRTYLSKGVGLRFSELETTGLQIPAAGEHWQERICFHLLHMSNTEALIWLLKRKCWTKNSFNNLLIITERYLAKELG